MGHLQRVDMKRVTRDLVNGPGFEQHTAPGNPESPTCAIRPDVRWGVGDESVGQADFRTRDQRGCTADQQLGWPVVDSESQPGTRHVYIENLEMAVLREPHLLSGTEHDLGDTLAVYCQSAAQREQVERAIPKRHQRVGLADARIVDPEGRRTQAADEITWMERDGGSVTETDGDVWFEGNAGLHVRTGVST
jgi:hypothetical protein